MFNKMIDDLPYNNIYEFMKNTLFLDEDKINELAFLLVTNLKVEGLDDGSYFRTI